MEPNAGIIVVADASNSLAMVSMRGWTEMAYKVTICCDNGRDPVLSASWGLRLRSLSGEHRWHVCTH